MANKLSGKEIHDIARAIVSDLRPLEDADREEVMLIVKTYFCPNCWRTLEPKELCHCANDE